MRTSTRAPSSDPTRQRLSGFTLLELSIILLVLGVVASFVVPRLRQADSLALSTSASRLATTARYLYEEAAFRRVPMRLNLDLDKQVYWVTVLHQDDEGEAPEFVPETTPLSRPVALPDAVGFADVVLPGLGTVKEGIVFAQFFPEGHADPLVVHLQNDRREYATMAIEPLTGRTRVADGYYEVARGEMRDEELDERSARERSEMTGRRTEERGARSRSGDRERRAR